ncbi:MAG: hypothetical protein WAM69_08140, partial [Candidatus Sulfotelmatobacter sp.]
AVMLGGSGTASGFSFNMEFTVSSSGVLSVDYFQFLTQGTCFAINGEAPTGSMILTLNSNDTVTGPFSLVVTGKGNTLTLNGTVTGTAIVTGNTQNLSSTLTGATVTGTWTLAGGTGCSATGGSFTMTQPSTT